MVCAPQPPPGGSGVLPVQGPSASKSTQAKSPDTGVAVARYRATFGEHLHFEQDHSWVRFPAALLDAPLAGHDRSVYDTLRAPLQAMMDQRMRDKLGLSGAHEGDRALVEDLLQALQQDRVDYTVFWRRLSMAVHESAHSTHAFEPVRDLFLHRDTFDAWCTRYLDRLGTTNRQAAGRTMLRTNPKYILRNHLGELAIRQAKTGNFAMVQDLLQVLHTPFDEHPAYDAWAGLAPEWASSIEISCSS